MKKNYVKMNNNNKFLSLGNIFTVIKNIAKGNSAMQSEIFCCLFDIKEINSTTVNNYCIGIRAIGLEYKKVYIVLKEKYNDDKTVFIDIVLSLISILDEHIYLKSDDSIDIINSNHNLKELCVQLLEISMNDDNISEEFTSTISKQIHNNNLYECIVSLLLYAILENKQPLYVQNLNIQINKKELDDYLKIKLYEGVSYITSLINLSKKNNIYACADLGSLEFDGLVNGKSNYNKAYDYYLKAADKGHPKACWMIANMILTKRVKYDFDILWKYLNKSIELGSAAGLNTMGKCYLEGINPDNKVDIDLAKQYFFKSSELGYTYAFNNLGRLYEIDGNMEKAYEYYKISADMGESWALNRVGEYYRKMGDMQTAYIYYTKSLECPISERCDWAKHNLDKYYNTAINKYS